MQFNRINYSECINGILVPFHTFAFMVYLIVLIVIVVIALIIVRLSDKNSEPSAETETRNEIGKNRSDCCGAHEICEFDASLFESNQIIYFDDEELDELRNIREDELNAKQIEDLREVLYSLRTDEIGKWLNSLSSRHIHLPAILQQEARHLMTEKSDNENKLSGKASI